MQYRIVNVAVDCAIACLVLYVLLTLSPLIFALIKYKPAPKPAGAKRTISAVTVTSLTELVKAFAALVDSLVKAGPALTALIGSLLFLVIAGFAAGIFTSGS